MFARNALPDDELSAQSKAHGLRLHKFDLPRVKTEYVLNYLIAVTRT